MSSGKGIEVTELSATCKSVAPSKGAGGHRATLALNIQLVGPDGVRYRGAGSQLLVRVYPIPERSPGRIRPAAKKKKKKKAAARA